MERKQSNIAKMPTSLSINVACTVHCLRNIVTSLSLWKSGHRFSVFSPPVPLSLPITLQRPVVWQFNFLLISASWEVINPDWGPRTHLRPLLRCHYKVYIWLWDALNVTTHFHNHSKFCTVLNRTQQFLFNFSLCFVRGRMGFKGQP